MTTGLIKTFQVKCQGHLLCLPQFVSVCVGGGLLVGGCFPQSHCISDIKPVSHMKTVPGVTLRGMWSYCDQSALLLIFPQSSTHRDVETVTVSFSAFDYLKMKIEGSSNTLAQVS